MSIQIASKYDLTQPYHVYYTLDLINNDTTGTKPLPVLNFNEIRNSPYLSAPENYFMSVIRFSVQCGPTLPVFIPQVQLGQADPKKLNYSFTMTYEVAGNPIEFQQFVQFIPTNVDQPTPNPPLDFQDLTTAYYFVYSYQQWAEMLNAALVSCFNGLNAAVVLAGGALPTTNPPFLEFDPQALVFILDADEVGYARTLANPIKIYCNSPLQTLLSTFQFIRYGNVGITNGKNFQFVIYNVNDTNVLVLPTYNALQMYQEGSTVALMNPIQSIVFSTSQVPVIQENVSVPKVFGSDSNLFNTGNNSNIASVLTDFQVPFSPDNRYQPDITYAPTGEYRLIDLYGTSPLSSLDLQVSWKDNFGGTHPLLLGAGCCANMKIMFRRKDFNTQSLFKKF